MFAQEGVMDIEKEREAFECDFKQTDYYIAHGDLSTLMLCDDQYALDDVQVSFEMWQAAKSQAVPEGFVLVDKHQLAQLMANMDSFGKKALGDDYVSFADIAAVLDEAQDSAND